MHTIKKRFHRSHHILFFLSGFFLLAGLIIALVFHSRPDSYLPSLYDPKDLSAFLSSHPEYVLLDVRNKKEYDRGHIPGAIHAPYHDVQALKNAAGDKKPITYCTYSAWRGPYAAYQLYKSGYTDIGILTGGIKSWEEQVGTLVNTDPLDTPFVYPHPEKDLLFPPRDLVSTASASHQDTIHIKMQAKKYTFSPATVNVRRGQRVVIDITSEDVSHGFSLPEYHIVEEILPKQTKRIEFIASRAGTFPFVCSVYCGSDRHTHESHMSMVGEIIVQ